MKTCAIDGCEKKVLARGWCVTHYERWRRHGDPNIVKAHAEFGNKNSSWRGDEVTYAAAHRRVRTARGDATEHQCTMCSDSAAQWAYDHKDHPEERTSPRGHAYSTKVEHYLALCLSCHWYWDRDRVSPRWAAA